MVEAIEQAVLREELRRRFGEEAALSEREVQSKPSLDRTHVDDGRLELVVSRGRSAHGVLYR
jgi:hypothetical protein